MDNGLQMSLLDDSPCVKPTGMTVYKRKKRKEIEIKYNGALVELNLLLLPLVPLGRGYKDVGTVIATWTDKEGLLRGIKLSMTDGYEMINSYDMRVLTTLMKLYSEDNSLIKYDFEKKEYDMPIEIKYTIREIAKRMKYSECGGSITKKIKQSIRKLANVTITNIEAGGMFDKNKDDYAMTREKGYHIIEEYDMYEYTNIDTKDRINPRDIKDFNKVVINNFFYKNMCKGYFKIIEFDQFISLKQDTSMRLFAIMEGWFATKKPYVYYKFETLYDRIPLSKSIARKEKNRNIQRAADELIKIGYISNYKVKKNEGIYFIFDDNLKDVDFNILQNKYLGLEKYQSEKEIVDAFFNYGLSEQEVAKYLNTRDLPYIKALLRYIEVLIRHDMINKDTPKGYLIKGLNSPYQINKKYYDSI